VAEDGVTTSGYGAEYAWQIRAVGNSPVGDEVIPSNAKNTSLACHVECLQPARVFLQQCPGFSTMKAYCQASSEKQTHACWSR